MKGRLGVKSRVELSSFCAEEKPQTINTQNCSEGKYWEHHDRSNDSVQSRSLSAFQHLPACHRCRQNTDNPQHTVEDGRENSTEDSYARLRVVSRLVGESDSECDEHTGGDDQQQQEGKQENRGKRAKADCQNFVVVGSSH